MRNSPRLNPTENPFREFLLILFEQKRVVLWTVFLVVALSLGVAVFWPPTYESSGMIIIKGKQSKRSPDTLETVEQKSEDVTREDLVSEAKIMTSYWVVDQAVRDVNARFRLLKPGRTGEAEMAKLIYSIREKLQVDVVPYSNIIQISFFYSNPELTREILDKIIDVYLARRSEVFNPKELQDFFARQVHDFDQFLQAEEEKLVALAGASLSADPGREIANNLNLKMQLELKLNQVRLEYADKKEFASYLERALGNKNVQFYAFIKNDTLVKLADKLQELMVERSTARKIYTAQSSVMARLDEQVRELSDTLNREVALYYKSIVSQVEILETSIAELKEEIQSLTQKNLQLYASKIAWERIQREIDVRSNTVQIFSKRLEEARIGGSNDVDNLFSMSVLSRPRTPISPIFPRPGLVMLLGTFSGILLGCCLAFVREYFDHTFKRPEDTERFAGMPTVFSIPNGD